MTQQTGMVAAAKPGSDGLRGGRGAGSRDGIRLLLQPQNQLPLQFPPRENKQPATKIPKKSSEKSSAVATPTTMAAGFEEDGERTRRRFRICPRGWWRWPEKRDQRSGGGVVPAAAMAQVGTYPSGHGRSQIKTL
jgi:hypothetical protein